MFAIPDTRQGGVDTGDKFADGKGQLALCHMQRGTPDLHVVGDMEPDHLLVAVVDLPLDVAARLYDLGERGQPDGGHEVGARERDEDIRGGDVLHLLA